MKRNSKVEKDLSPDESAIIADIESLLNQLKQGEVAEGEEIAPGMDGADVGMDVITDGQPAGDEEQEEFEDEKIVGKDETAREDAETRVGELPEDDEEALKVLKALIGVGKSADRRPAPRRAVQAGDSSRTLAMIAKSLAILARKVDRVEDSMVGVLEGIGVTDKIVQKSAARKPVQTRRTDTQALVDVLREAFVGKSAEVKEEPAGDLRTVLTTLVGDGR